MPQLRTAEPTRQRAPGSASPVTARRPSRADAVVVFAATDRMPSEADLFECRAARALARHVPVVYVTGSGGASSRRGVLERLRDVVRVPERDPAGPIVLRPRIVDGVGGSVMFSGGLLARQLEVLLGRARHATPSALICHPRAAHALGREAWSSVVYAPNERELRLPAPPEPLLAADRRLRDTADQVVDLVGLGLAGSGQSIARAEPPSALLRELESAPGPRYVACGSLDGPELDGELLVRIAERLDRGTLIVPLGHAGALVERLDEIDRVRVVPAEWSELLSVADVALAPFESGPDLADERLADLVAALSRGLPVVTTRFDESGLLDGLVRTALDPAGFASALRSAFQERDDSLVTRRKRRAAEVRWQLVEERLLESLRVPRKR